MTKLGDSRSPRMRGQYEYPCNAHYSSEFILLTQFSTVAGRQVDLQIIILIRFSQPVYY